jgi:hypothetical protein
MKDKSVDELQEISEMRIPESGLARQEISRRFSALKSEVKRLTEESDALKINTPVSDDDIVAWGERHDLRITSLRDLKCAFDDARTWQSDSMTKEERGK